MSSPVIVTVPDGMSCVNAFRALWENSKPAAFFRSFPAREAEASATVATAEKVANLFRAGTYFDYAGGRMLKTEFSAFPKLDVRLYDRDFGPGAAQKAIEKYNRIHPSERFDRNDSYKFEELTCRTWGATLDLTAMFGSKVSSR